MSQSLRKPLASLLLATLFLLAVPAKAEEAKDPNTLYIDTNQVTLALDFTLAELAFLHQRAEDLASRLEQGPIVVELKCSAFFEATLESCWPKVVNEESPAIRFALERILRRYVLARNPPVLSPKATEAIRTPEIFSVSFSVELTNEHLAAPDPEIEPPRIEAGGWNWAALGNAYSPLGFNEEASMEAECRAYADFTVFCRALSVDPERRFYRLDRWLHQASLDMRVEPELTDGSPATDTIGPMRFSFRPSE